MTRLTLALALLASPVMADTISVTDGDTVKICPTGGACLSLRFADVDAPEKSRPHGECPEEIAMGLWAGDRLRALIHNATHVRYFLNGEDCGWGRFCGTLFLDGEDVRRIGLREGWMQHDPFIKGRRVGAVPDWCEGVTTVPFGGREK